jgi:hypothetical protein
MLGVGEANFEDRAMTDQKIPPQWITDLVASTRTAIGVGDEWEINVSMFDLPLGTGGECDMTPEYLTAELRFSNTIKDDAEGHAVVAHEVTHLALAEIEWIVSRILDRVHKGERGVLRQVCDDVVERTVQRLTRAIDCS